MVVKHRTNTLFVFDLDDTLVETTRANNMAYAKAYTLVTGKEFVWSGGRVTRSIFEELDRDMAREIVKTKEKVFVEYLNKTRILPCMSILIGLKGERRVLLSNSRRLRGLQICEYYGIVSEFDKMFFREDLVQENKYKSILLQMQWDANNTIVFENSEEDKSFAIASGIPGNNIFIQK